MSRELFRELAGADGPGSLTAFKALMHASIALRRRREGLVSTEPPATQIDPAELLSFWLDAHALGHLALLAYQQNAPWFTEMVHELRLENWTPTYALTCERIMGVTLRGAVAVGRLGPAALELYLEALKRPSQPLEHFDAVLALASLALQWPSFASPARLAVEEWAGRATSASALRKELLHSFATVLDDPDGARDWSLAWCRQILELRGSEEAQTVLGLARRAGVSEKAVLLLSALGHSGDSGSIVDDLSPAIVLLAYLSSRASTELYSPAELLDHVNDRWTPELGADVLRRTVAARSIAS